MPGLPEVERLPCAKDVLEAQRVRRWTGVTGAVGTEAAESFCQQNKINPRQMAEAFLKIASAVILEITSWQLFLEAHSLMQQLAELLQFEAQPMLTPFSVQTCDARRRLSLASVPELSSDFPQAQVGAQL